MDQARSIINVEDENELQSIFELARKSDHSNYEILLNTVKSHFHSKVGSNVLNHLAKVRWSACISLTIDNRFESALQNHYSALPTPRDVSVVAKGGLILPPATIPIYKLHGDIYEVEPASELAIAKSDVMKRRLTWSNILLTCSDYVKDAPLVFLGTENNLEDVTWLLTALSSMQGPIPKKLIFLNSDPTLSDPTVSSLLSSFNVECCDTTILEAADGLANLKPRQGTLSLAVTNPTVKNGLFDQDKYKQIVSLVPNSLPDNFDYSSNHSAVIDALFRPHQINWIPYMLELAAERKVTSHLIKHIKETMASSSAKDIYNFILLRGDASVGKTTILKQIAVALAKEQYIVIWVRRRWSGSPTSLFKQLIYDIDNQLSKTSGDEIRILVICDNPFGLNISPREILAYFSTIRCNVKFIFSVRNSDYLSIGEHDKSLSTTTANDFEVDNVIADEELEALANMLVKTKAEQNIESALEIVKQLTTRHSMDVLCSLWYLVPETKAVISNSLEEEYLRLGRVGPAIASTASSLNSTSDIARNAYEAVTVVSNMGEGLPLEILVRYLKVGYDYMLELYDEGTPIWGLIYDEVSEESETVLFKTRNEVVTKVLLDLVNGGSAGHSGEARVIRNLIEASDGGSTVYREFIITILVKCKDRIKSIFTYEQGIEIFDLARNSLPHKDRTLEHHKGLWMKSETSQLAEAYKQLEYAESCDDFPGTNRQTPIQHIYTSKAATVLQMIQSGQQDRDSGAEEISKLLNLATAESLFDGHTVHVAARTYFQLSQTSGEQKFTSVAMESICKALYAIENGLQKIGTMEIHRNRQRNIQSVELLRDLKSQILSSTSSLEDIKKEAKQQYEKSKDGLGFVLAAQIELNIAIEKNNGTKYNQLKEYLDSCIALELIEEHSLRLRAVRVDLIIRWRLQKTSGQLIWSEFRDDLDLTLSSNLFKDDTLKIYYFAVACYHLDQIPTANAHFASLRRSNIRGIDKSLVRCWFVSKEGSRERFQCNIERDGVRYYAKFPKLRMDCPLKNRPTEAGAGGVSHAYLGFSLFGPVPIFDGSSISANLLLA